MIKKKTEAAIVSGYMTREFEQLGKYVSKIIIK